MAMKDCNNCFASVDENATFCPHCGASMRDCKATVITPSKSTTAKKECKICFATIDANARVCPHCGAATSSPSDEYIRQKRSNRASTYIPAYKTGSFWLGFFLGILGIILAACIFQDSDSIKNAAWGILAGLITIVLFSILPIVILFPLGILGAAL